MEVGATATRSLALTAEHVATYAELTGDYNPLHFDGDFAGKTKFGRLEAWCYTFTPPLP
jgi:acyl dehydratase